MITTKLTQLLTFNYHDVQVLKGSFSHTNFNSFLNRNFYDTFHVYKAMHDNIKRRRQCGVLILHKSCNV